jgi:hypothetical protein
VYHFDLYPVQETYLNKHEVKIKHRHPLCLGKNVLPMQLFCVRLVGGWVGGWVEGGDKYKYL